MLSVADCRRILGPQSTLTDAEVEELREQIRKLAVFAVDAWTRDRGDSTT